MNVTLPDGSALELPDGASALDAARAIGPKLAEQAVLARVDGEPRDLRLPLPDGATLQILTTRDRDDPDALAVLRHSAAHLLAEAVRRLHPGVKVAIGPPIDNGFYYDFEFPEPIHEADLEAIEAEIARELDEGRTWERLESTRDEARTRFEAEGEPYKVELVDTADGDISLYTQGDFTDLCRGPHLQDSAPIKALQAHRARRRVLARRREEHAAHADLRHRVLHAGRPRRAPRAARAGARERPPPASARSSTCSTSRTPRPARRSGIPKGMTLWNVLEDLRRAENARRGYLEVKTPLIYDKVVWQTSGHWEKFRGEMFLVAGEGEEPRSGLKPMNCPGHMLLFGSQLRSYRELPLRYAESSTLHRNEPTGTLHGLLRVRHVTQDDAHIFCTREQIEDGDLRLPRLRRVPLRALRDGRALRALHPARRQARHRRGVGLHGGGAPLGARAARASTTTSARARARSTGPKIDLHMLDVLGRSWQMGTIQLDAQMPKQFGLTYMGADNVEHTPYVVHRALLGSLERFMGILIEHYAGAFPAWLAPVQVRVLPVAEPHREAADELVGALRLAGVRVDTDERDETLGKRIRDAELAEDPATSSSGAIARRASRWRCASAAAEGVSTMSARRARRGDRSSRAASVSRRCSPAAVPCYALLLQAGAASPLTSPAMSRARFNRVESDEGMPPLHAVACSTK